MGPWLCLTFLCLTTAVHMAKQPPSPNTGDHTRCTHSVFPFLLQTIPATATAVSWQAPVYIPRDLEMPPEAQSLSGNTKMNFSLQLLLLLCSPTTTLLPVLWTDPKNAEATKDSKSRTSNTFRAVQGDSTSLRTAEEREAETHWCAKELCGFEPTLNHHIYLTQGWWHTFGWMRL